MKYLFSIVLLIFSNLGQAHNMPDDIKITQIKKALVEYSTDISNNDITLDFSEYQLTYNGMMDKFEDGDQDIQEFFVYINTGKDRVRINCDFISGYVEDTSFSTLNFIIFKNCKIKSLTSYKIQQIELDREVWPGNRY
jgi:hypothetical protein